MVGSPEYNADGSQVLGQAEGARKITLFDGNSYNPSDADWIRSIMHTIEHEFAHILHQTKCMIPVSKIYPPEIIIRQDGLLKRK